MTQRNWRIPLLIAAAFAIVAVAMSAIVRITRRTVDRSAEFPAPRADTVTEVSRADFVGAETCGSCHAQQFAAWSRSTHGRAGGEPSREQIIAPFDGTPIRFRDAVVVPAVSAKGEYTFTVRQDGVGERLLKVDGVVGKGHMVGGGSQTFFSRFPDGTLRLLPFDYMKRERVWFCNAASAKAGAWTPITRDMSITECLNWTPHRALGDQPRMPNCSGCHGSQIELEFDTTAKLYVTKVASLKINCESCHGPGRVHIERVRSGVSATSADIGMRPLATLGRDSSMAVCLQCHSLRSLLEPGYLSGKRFEEHYSLKLGLLSDKAFYPDGRTRQFAYQEGQLSSECTRNGSLQCADCHDPHSQTYRDINGKALAGRLDNGQCVDCHASKAEPIERHTKHRAGSPGSRCVSCHMPYLQEPLLGDALHFARSDHTIPVPRPAYEKRWDIRNACTQCHTDRSIEQIETQITAWYGTLKPQPWHVARLDSALASRDLAAAARLALMPEGFHPMAQFAGLDFFFETQLAPDMIALDPEAVAKLKQLADHPDLDVRALALASLHLARGEDKEIRTFLASRLRTLGADDEAIRKRWALSLAFRGDLYGRFGNFGETGASYRKALEIRPGDAALLLQIAVASLNAGDVYRAEQHVTQSIAANAGESRAFVLLGLIRDRKGDLSGAMAAYVRAIAVNPHDANAEVYLGDACLKMRNESCAIRAYERAVQLDPSLASVHFNLARLYLGTGKNVLALGAVRRGLAFAPTDSAGRTMLRDIEQTLSGKTN